MIEPNPSATAPMNAHLAPLSAPTIAISLRPIAITALLSYTCAHPPWICTLQVWCCGMVWAVCPFGFVPFASGGLFSRPGIFGRRPVPSSFFCLPFQLKVAAVLPDGCIQFNPARLAYRGSTSVAVDNQLPALYAYVGNVKLGSNE